LSAAGFIAISTSTASPGVKMSLAPKWIWKPLTPGSVPAGARISAGKSGKVARSFPKSAVVLVNWLPVICMPSPESPAKRITALSSVSLRRGGAVVVSVAMLLASAERWGAGPPPPRQTSIRRTRNASAECRVPMSRAPR
jgi:hypothetical protein